MATSNAIVLAGKRRDSLGELREDAFYQTISTSKSAQRMLVNYYSKRRWIEDPSYSRGSDADILEKVRRDPVICKAMDLRLHMVTGNNFYWDAPDEPSRALLPYFERLLKKIPGFRKSVLALASGIYTGVSFLRMVGNGSIGEFRVPPDDRPRPWWLPYLVHIGRDSIRREYKIEKQANPECETEDKVTHYWTTWDKFQNRWYRIADDAQYAMFLYHDDEDTLGYGRPLLDAIYFYYRCKTELLKFMLQGIERFAVPWVMIGIDPDAHAGTNQGTGLNSPEDLAASYLEIVDKMRAGNAMALDKRHSITTLDFSGEAASGLLRLIEYFDERLVQMILAASMPSGGGSEGGSYARAAVEAGSTSNLIRFDRCQLEESLEPLTYQLWEQNRPNFAKVTDSSGRLLVTLDPPTLRIGREQIDDPRTNLDLIQRALSVGIPLRRTDIYRMLNLPIPDSGDDVIGGLGSGGPNPAPGGMFQNPITGQPTQGPVQGMNDGVRMAAPRVNAQKFAQVVREMVAKERFAGGAATVADYVEMHRRAVA